MNLAYLPALQKINASLLAVYSRSTKSAEEAHEAASALPGLVAPSYATYSDEKESSGHGLNDLLKRDDIKAVIVSLPTLVQPAIVMKALAAGKHVLMEKPLAKDVAASEAIIDEYEAKYQSKGLVLSVAEQFRFDAGHEKARQIIASGAIGKLENAHARVWQLVVPGNKWYETPWRKNPGYVGGFLLDGGVHFVSFLRYVSGGEITETASFAKQTIDYLPPLDTVQAALKFESGALGTLSMSFASARNEYEYVFVGDKGSLKATGEAGGTRIIVSDKKDEVVSDEVVGGSDTYAELFRSFLKSAEVGKGDPRGAPRQAITDVAVVESICSGGGKVKKYL
jgi:predicted dehydrogenase